MYKENYNEKHAQRVFDLNKDVHSLYLTPDGNVYFRENDAMNQISLLRREERFRGNEEVKKVVRRAKSTRSEENDMTVSELSAHLDGVFDFAELCFLREKEIMGANRKTALEAIDARIELINKRKEK